ncbi:MAG: ABC transporter permease [Deltaproteobacteria bacterium]|nr:ABC transporter permease [Deltaproteobacteria bacterium]
MNLWVASKIAYKALRSYKVRSILTTIGIIIGVAAVITMMALTQGAKLMIEEKLTSLGGNSLIVNAGKRARSGTTLNVNKEKPLMASDANAIRGLRIVRHVSEIIDTAEQVVSGNMNWFTTIVGASPDFTYINDWLPDRGSFFNNEDVRNAELVCVIGTTVASKLFGNQDPIGKIIRIGGFSYRVIGVMSPIGQTPGGEDQDDLVFIPYTTVQKRIMGISYIENISVSVNSTEDVLIAQQQITQILRDRRKIGDDMEDDFYVNTQLVHIERIFTVSKIMTILLGSIASISLLVGGIGIMNIMLVSVKERTREIGIRMAVGAKALDILIQFMIEAVLLSVVGGFIGIILGISASTISSSFTNWPSVVSATSIILSFCFAAIVGIFFGIYPARKASQLDPIESLRYG